MVKEMHNECQSLNIASTAFFHYALDTWILGYSDT